MWPIRLAAKDTALSRRRSRVRIPYGLPITVHKAGHHSVEKFLNTYSFVIIAMFIATTVFLIAQSRLGLKAGLIGTACTIFVLLIFQVISTNSQQGLEPPLYPQTTNSMQEPSLVVVYSNYWAVCLAAKPFVDRLETELAGRVTVTRVDSRTINGQNFMRNSNVVGVPTYLLLDQNGSEILRALGRPPSAEAIRKALRLSHTNWCA